MKSTKTIFIAFLGCALCALLSPVMEDLLDPYIFMILMYAGINVTLAVSLNLVNGITGQFSIGHAGFMSVGAYVSSVITLNLLGQYQISFLPETLSNGVMFAISLVSGGIVAAFLGYIVGLPSLKLKGDYLAIVTLGFGEIIRVIFLNIDAVGGARGLPGIPKIANFGWIYSVAFLCVFVLTRLMMSSHGRAFLAVREDEIAAQAMGINTTRYKVNAFVIGAFFAGIAGGLFAHYLTYINPKIFDFNRSFEIITMVVLGGMGSITGAVLAALFLTFLRELLRPLQDLTGIDLRMVIYSLMLVILMLTRPNGFLGRKEITDFTWFKKINRKIRGNPT